MVLVYLIYLFIYLSRYVDLIRIYNLHVMLVIIRVHTLINYNNFSHKMNYWVPCVREIFFRGTLQFNCQI